ncbi:substrate-binding domain-containing protein [bacterium AH-315-O15]|nr:substrate-binding domain-containing protein [bacterium AH-315-O15]
MKRHHTYFLFSLMLLLAVTAQGNAQNSTELQQVKVVTSGGFTAAFNILGPIFEQATGIKVITEYGSSMGGGPQSIPVRLERGETSDLLIFNGGGFDDIAATGKIRPATRVELARSITGMAIRSGTLKPDISTMESFVKTLLAAESIGYSASVSGTYLSTVVFPELGIWDQIRGKTTRVVGERVASVVARGEVELGFQARSEILPIDGADYLGPIPDEIQRVATIVVVMTERMSNMENARKLVGFLSSKAAAVVIESTGLMPVALEELE